VHNNQRDGLHRQAIHRGRVSYEPNSLAGGCPFQAGAAHGFVSVQARLQGKDDQAKVRAKPEKFADHYTQAALFYDSQSPAEQAHIAAAFRFELSKLTVPAVRQRMVASLRNVNEALAAQIGAKLGMDPLPDALPPALARPPKPEVARSPTLSLLARPGDGSLRGRKVALLVAPGIVWSSLAPVQKALTEAGAVCKLVGPCIGPQASADGTRVDADASLENEPGFLFDAMVLPDGAKGVDALLADARTVEYTRDTFRHCKPLLAIGAGACVLAAAGIAPDPADKALVVAAEGADAGSGAAATKAFIAALEAPRNFARESDPPRV
jgi:catalase